MQWACQLNPHPQKYTLWRTNGRVSPKRPQELVMSTSNCPINGGTQLHDLVLIRQTNTSILDGRGDRTASDVDTEGLLDTE